MLSSIQSITSSRFRVNAHLSLLHICLYINIQTIASLFIQVNNLWFCTYSRLGVIWKQFNIDRVNTLWTDGELIHTFYFLVKREPFIVIHVFNEEAHMYTLPMQKKIYDHAVAFFFCPCVVGAFVFRSQV